MDTGAAGTGTDFHTGTGKNWHINTRTGHFGKFGTTSIPVPGNLVSSVRHPHRYRGYRYRTQHTRTFASTNKNYQVPGTNKKVSAMTRIA